MAEELVFELKPVNPEVLHAELAMALGVAYASLSTGRGLVRIHLAEGTIAEEVKGAALAVVEAHDAGKLTSSRQAEADRVARLEALSKPWAQWTAADREEFLRILAEQAGIVPPG